MLSTRSGGELPATTVAVEVAMVRHIHLYDYVHRPFAEVRDALADHPGDYVGEASEAAMERARDVEARLSVDLGGFDVRRDIVLHFEGVEHSSGLIPSCYLRFRWEAESGAGLFPRMDGEIEATPLTDVETQIIFTGTYRPPLGPVGAAIDSMLLHRVAEAALQRFFHSVVSRIAAPAS